MKHFFASNFINNQKAENYFNFFLNAEIKCPTKKTPKKQQTFINKIKSNLFNFNAFFNKYFVLFQKNIQKFNSKIIIYLLSYSELLKNCLILKNCKFKNSHEKFKQNTKIVDKSF